MSRRATTCSSTFSSASSKSTSATSKSTSATSKSTSEARLWALVRWANGAQAGTLTHNVDVAWIQDFSPVLHVDPDATYTVEWRKPPMPKNGWALYDCQVIEVSSDVEFLKRKMEIRTPSPPPIVTTAVPNPTQCETHATPRRTADHEPENLRDILNLLRSSLAGQGSHRAQGAPLSCPTDENQQVVKVGTSLVITKTQLIEAKAAMSPSVMTMNLVRSAFSRRRLRKSSYAGQTRKDKPIKPGLKKYRKMQDIQDFVKTRFPYFSQSAFGASVNSCLGKNVDKERQRQFVDESDSEEDDEMN